MAPLDTAMKASKPDELNCDDTHSGRGRPTCLLQSCYFCLRRLLWEIGGKLSDRRRADVPPLPVKLAQIEGWRDEFERLHARLRPHAARSRTHDQMKLHLEGVLGAGG